MNRQPRPSLTLFFLQRVMRFQRLRRELAAACSTPIVLQRRVLVDHALCSAWADLERLGHRQQQAEP